MNQTLPTLGAARGALVSLSSLWLAVGACAEAPPPSAGDVAGARVAIAVAPLSLPGVADATWTLTVSSPGGEVWTKTVTSSGYGDGAGGLAYVGPCDASYATNTVTVELIDLTADGGGAITDFRNPGPVSKTAPCDPNGDTAVGFDITVARAANQGFFDVAVSFDDVFCSAKLDCVPELLFNGAARDTTLVLAFACASGEGTATTLHMAAPKLTCSDGTELVVDPTLGPGNTGESNAHVYQVASYRGREAFSGLEKCYWNTAIGVDATTFTANSGVTCSVTAKVSASVGAWDDGQTPEGAVWPFIDVDVPVVADGALVCASHALDVDGSGVATDYALPDARETLDVGMSCGGCDGGPCAPAVATGAPVTPFATEGAGWSWGADEGGALGNGPAETTNKLTPVAITTAGGVPATWSRIYPGGNGIAPFACGLTADHVAWCWGKNDYGQGGDGATTDDHESPVPLSGGLVWQELTLGGYHACGLTPGGVAYCWGGNQYGQMGDGTKSTTDRVLSPTPVSTAEIAPGSPRPLTYRRITASRDATCGVAETPASLAGTAWCWGASGALGIGVWGESLYPTPVDVSDLSETEPRPHTWLQLDAGTYSVCGIAATPASIAGTAWCWGANDYCQAGKGGLCSGGLVSSTPVATAGSVNGVDRPLTYRSIDQGGEVTCAIAEPDGSAWCWGYNGSGQLGNGEHVGKVNLPTPVNTVVNPVRSISASGNHVCAIPEAPNANAGKAYCWGYTGYGAVGTGAGSSPGYSAYPGLVSGQRQLLWLLVNQHTSYAIEAPAAP